VRKTDELAGVASTLLPDLILITETWCHSDISDAYLSIDGYEVQADLRLDRQDTAHGRGGGLLVYVRNGVKVLKIDRNISFHQYCKFLVGDVTLYLIYRSPNAPAQSITELEQIVRAAEKNSVLIGDFNLPEIDWAMGTSSGRSRSLVEAVEDSLMEQMVNFSTQVKGNCLDLVLTNIPERIYDISEAGRLGSSDHEMLSITLIMDMRTEGSNRPTLNWKRANLPSLRAELATVDWSTMRTKTVEEMWTFFRSKISEAVARNVPLRTIRGRGRPGWLTQQIMAAIRRKQRLWKNVKRGRRMEEYEVADKEVKRMIRNAKRSFEKGLAGGNGGNSRPFYAYIKQKTKTRQGIGPLRNENKETVSEDHGMAELLNNFFSSVFTRENTGHIPTAPEMETSVLEDVIITEKKVREKIRKLKTESATGPDEIGPRLLQELETELIPPLVTIFRKSITTGEVPEEWRSANVTPIFKKGSKAEPGNYRPVSLTSVCCKILESVMRDEIMDHLSANNLLNQSQHGFMPGKSCSTNLLEFLEKATKVIDGGLPFDVIFLDFAKAFDKVPRERLLEKLRAHGVRGRALNWIRSWLTGRKQRVVLNGKYSSWAEVLSGVPQGSVLGPILFLIFINDLDNAALLVDILRKFADDTKLGQTVSTPEERAALQQTLDNLCEWADNWGMEFNVKKCKVMHLGYTNTGHSYSMNNQQLTETEEERDIGVCMASNLKPSAQCAQAARAAQTVLSQITRAFHYRDRHVFKKLYVQYVRPHLEFAAVAWSPWLEADKAALEKIQKRAVKMVSGLKGTTYEEKLKELGLTSLEERRHQIDMTQTFKIMHGIDKVQSSTWFEQVDTSVRTTRSAADPLNLKQQTVRLDLRRNFFSVRAVEGWNMVPRDIKNARTVQIFKKAYRKHREEMVGTA